MKEAMKHDNADGEADGDIDSNRWKNNVSISVF